MNISYRWIQQFINIDIPSESLSVLLTDLGLEVEGITPYESVKGSLEGIVVGEIIACEQHSNADRLKVTVVDIGGDAPLSIVCGAPNVSKGQKVAIATVGTTLYDEKGDSWKIKKSKIRGELSEGMICAEDELGLGNTYDGIMVLSDDIAVGTPLSKIIEVINDTIFEIGITPNRADALSHYGTARDLRAGLLQQKGIEVDLKMPSFDALLYKNTPQAISVEISSSELVPRYCGLTISGISVTDSPQWMQDRLKAIGITPKNNIVDITNYVLHELGQPLHAFDAATISRNKIFVHTMPKDTPFVTLDGQERKLHENDLIIGDADKPLCIAGVFGGLHTGITLETTSIFLESAYFNPISVRKTAKRHLLNTDASYRFERGIDPDNVVFALERAASLILEIAGGEIASELIDIYPNPIPSHEVSLSTIRLKKLLGVEIDDTTIKSILATLDIIILREQDEILDLRIPAYRVDVTREVDVFEEILRVYGYDNIPVKKSISISLDNSKKSDFYKIEQRVSERLIAQGFTEIMTNSLTQKKQLASTSDDSQSINIINALSADLSVMRESMLYSGLEVLAYNCNRKQNDLSFFEFGKTYHKVDNQYKEYKHLSILVSGQRNNMLWNTPTRPMDFFYLKGVVISVLDCLGCSATSSEPVESEMFSEGIILRKNEIPLVSLGMVCSDIVDSFEVNQEVLFADFDWENVLSQIPDKSLTVSLPSKFPEVRRDLALLIDEQVSFIDIMQIARQTERRILKDVGLFDVYQGKNLPQGKKSYGVYYIFQNINKTLTDREVDKVMSSLIDIYKQKIGATLR